MPSIRITDFGGLNPAIKSRNLQAPFSTIAINTRLWDTSLRAFNRPGSPDLFCRVAECRTNNCDDNAFRTIYRSKTNLYAWCEDICVVEGQPFYDQDLMVLFESPDNFLSKPIHSYLFRNSLLPFGVPPRPSNPPTISVYFTMGSINLPTEEISYTYSPTTIEPAVFVGGSGNINPDDNPTAPTPVRTVIEGNEVTITKDIGPTINSSTKPLRSCAVIVYTYVNYFGDESAPSPPVTLDPVFTGDRFMVCGFTPSPPGLSIDRIRVYITNYPFELGKEAQPSLESDFFLIGEIPYGQDCLDAVYDQTCFQGDLLVTHTDCPPWPCMECVRELELGALVGWCECNVYMSERHCYGAWPQKYEITLQGNVSNIAIYYNVAFVTTDRLTYKIKYSVNEQGMLVWEILPYQEHYPIATAGSMVPTNFGAIYASMDGLIGLTDGALKLLTRDVINPDDWKELIPDIAAWHKGIYYGFKQGTTKGFAFDFNDAASGSFTKGSFYELDMPEPIWSLHSGKDGHLYMGMGDKVVTYDTDAQPLVYTWRSKNYVFPALVNWAAAKVVGPYDRGSVTFRLLANDIVKFERQVDSSNPFRLPNCNYYLDWQVELVGSSEVCEVHLATSLGELREQQ